MSDAKTGGSGFAYSLFSVFAFAMVAMILAGFGPFPSLSDIVTGDTRSLKTQSCYQTQNSCVSFEHVLRETACADRFWTRDRPDADSDTAIALYEYLTGLDTGELRNWAYEAKDRGYFTSKTGLFEGHRTTGKLYEYTYSLNRSECLPVLRNASIPDDEITGGAQ